jgi:mono/diheme cytochrome c family protein
MSRSTFVSSHLLARAMNYMSVSQARWRQAIFDGARGTVFLYAFALITLNSASSISLASEPATEAAKVSFSRQVLPILSDKCFACHGPDAPQDGTLRLDSFKAATEQLAIDPDDLESSNLISRIHSADDPMPPVDAEKQLSEGEREILTQWVRQGGQYEQHWAFVRPAKTGLSEAGTPDDPPQPETAIDYFIEARLAQENLTLAPLADRHTLARRVALTLTGLPPEPDQLKRFLTDSSEQAYEKLLDELFSSPHFGEHQARYWLDAVRYGDTHGLHLDNRRGIYPYRDWVVKAFNQNLPLDDFITWQLAGDLLPQPTLEQLTATGFVRMNPSTGEGGAIAAEFQAKNNFDRTEALGTVLLGMSLNCARCHTHKYDPIPHREYYSLLAFFNSTAEPALDGNSYTYGNTARVPKDQAAWQAWEDLQTQRKAILAQADRSLINESSHAELLEQAKQSSLSVGNWQASEASASDSPADIPPEEFKREAANLTDLLKDQELSANEAIWAKLPLTVATAQTVWFTFNGQTDWQLWVDGKEFDLSGANEPTNGYANVPIQFGSGEHEILLRIPGPKPNITVELFNPWQPLATAGDWHSLSQDDQLFVLGETEPFTADAQEAIQAGRQLERQFTTTLVARDLPQPRETRVLRRGEYDLPIGDPLEPGVLSVLGGLPEDSPRNRLGLASWLTSPEHPLVSRVIVNQLWQRVFGLGLVRTPEDFGLQGQQPTHPELLDWLAVELQESNWDLKHLLRLMVTSQTFMQSSRWRDEVKDPENLLWARGPSYRLDAEVIRDLGLWASELLDPRLGGEGVKPYQPAGMWRALAHPASNTKQYDQDQGALLYRRSLYVYWKRTSPHPMMTLFDAPDRETSCVRRSRTNTSLQSLGLFNETQRIEIGRKLAERLLRAGDPTAARLNRLFMLLASRSPTDQEAAACEQLLQQLKLRYQESHADALALLSTGEAPRDELLEVPELAAWTQLCVTILASDAAIMLY